MNANASLKEELTTFLRKRGEAYGMWEPKLTRWVHGMSDEGQSRDLLNSVLSKLAPSPDDLCLDIGCGFGNLVIALRERFEDVSGIEIVPERAEWAKKRCPSADIICGSATELPWPENHFGLITSTDVFEHLDRSQQVEAAKELARVLKPGGSAFITVPSRFQIRDEHNYVLFGTWMPDRCRKYVSMRMHGSYVECWEHSGPGWTRLFQRAGLNVETVPLKSKTLRITTSRFHLFVTKPAQS